MSPETMELRSLKHAFTSGISAPIPGGIGYCKGNAIHADQIHLGQIGEGEHLRPLDYLAGLTLPQHMTYLGVGGMLNLSYIARLQPRHAVLFDVNPLQTLFWDTVIENLKTGSLGDFTGFLKDSQTAIRDKIRRDFAGINLSTAGCCTNEFNMNSRPDSPRDWDRGFFRGLSPETWLRTRDTAAHDWMTPDRYAVLQAMARRGTIDAMTLDILDAGRCKALGELISDAKPDCTTIYVNSLRRFLNGDKDWTGRRGLNATQENFDRNIQLLLKAPQRIVIEDNTLQHATPSAAPHTMRF